MWSITGFLPRTPNAPASYVGLGVYPWRWMATATAKMWQLFNKDSSVDFRLG